MKETHTRLLAQISQMAFEGRFGDTARAAQSEYNQLPPGLAVPVKVVMDFCEEISRQGDELGQLTDFIFQLLIVAYREAKRKDPIIASNFLHSFLQDYPGVSESALLPRWNSLVQASLAYREVAYSQNRLLVWQQTTRLVQAYNEFLNGLLGYLIILWQTVTGKPVNIAVFEAPYGSKVSEFSSLTGGENGAFYVLIRLARPKLRNAIAHETIWLDSDAGKVRYTEGRNPRAEYAMDLEEFLCLAAAGSRLAHPYLAATAAIAILESGTGASSSLLPPRVVALYNHTRANT